MKTRSREEQLQAELEELRGKLASSNARYEELRHRVRNEFQAFLSSFSVQQKKHHTPDSCTECITRMWSVVTLHESLDTAAASINMGDYLRSMSVAFETAFGGPIHFATSVEPDSFLDSRRATCVGQVFCEAAMNAVKHGFPNGSSGDVKTSLWRSGNEFELIIANNGAAFDIEAAPSRGGCNAMAQLALEINGELHREALQTGMQVRLTFPV